MGSIPLEFKSTNRSFVSKKIAWIYILVGVVLVLQVGIFIWGRRIRKHEKENNVLVKYNINSRQRAWQLLADQSIPDEDKVKIREVYDGDDSKV